MTSRSAEAGIGGGREPVVRLPGAAYVQGLTVRLINVGKRHRRKRCRQNNPSLKP